MYSGIYNNKCFKIIVILLAVILIASCCAIFLNNAYYTYAFTEDNLTSSTKDLGKILIDGYADRTDGKVFKEEALTSIYNALTGRENSTLNDVKNLSALTAAEIRTKNGGNDILLTLDDRQWTITHFTKDTDGNPIITLWLASAAETSAWNIWYEGTSSIKFPSNMYSSSYIRAVALNSGTGYAAVKNATELTAIPEADKLEHTYANLTMPKDKVKGSLTSYMVTPSKVAYQGTENQNVGGTIGGVGWTLPNDAYGTPEGTVKYFVDGSINMSSMPGKTGYSDWQNDYIWLPSLTETGYGDSIAGIWDLSVAQRTIDEGYTWLRSGYSWYADVSCLAAGGARSSLDVYRALAVRPAFHLNLSAADSSSANIVSSPTDFKVTYDGTAKSISSAEWYDRDIHGNSDKMTVTYSQASPTNYGEYTVKLTIKDNALTWSDATSPTDKERTCKMTIEKAEATVTPIIGTGPYYPGSDMPSITLSPGDTQGSIAWEDSKLAEGKTTYNWKFTSSDSNYKNKTGSRTFTLSSIQVASIEVSYTASGTIYTSTNLDSLKNRLTVIKKNNNGSSAGQAEDSEYSLSGSLNAGKSTITVTLKGTSISTTFEVDVTAVALSSITASITSGSEVYTTTQLDDIKAMLTVTGTNNDGSTVNVTSDKYKLSCEDVEEGGTLPAGSQTLKLTLNSDTDITCNVTVQVGEPDILKIVATKLDTFPTTVYDITPLNTLKQYLKVVVTYADDDGTTKELAAKDYTIEGTLTAGRTNTLTIKYGGKSTTISVTGVISVTVTNIEVIVSQSGILYSSAMEEDIKGCLIVTVTYNNGTDDVLTADGYEVVIPQGFSSENNKVTIKCGDKSAEATLEVTDVISTGIDVEYTDGGEITVDSTREDLLSGIKLTLKYNDGSSKEITPTIDMLSGSMDSIGNKTINVTYTDPDDSTITHTDTFTVNVGKGTYDMSGVKFEDKTVTRDGNTHTLEIEGELPEGVSVTYSVEGQSGISFTEVGEYIFTATFTHSNTNYNDITSLSAKLTISEDEFDVSSLVFEDTVVGYDGEEHSIEIENVPEWLSVEYEGNGQIEIGSYTITAKFTHNNPNYGEIPSLTATLTIGKGKLAKPVYKGDIRYTGELIIPEVSDFEGYIEGVMEIVAEKTEEGLFVGKYTIVFAIKDTEHYEWEDSESVVRVSRVSISGNAVLVLTDSISLASNETAVEWSIGKAKLTATKKDGALPVFSSTSYKGALDEVITYKYYTDKECTEEIAKEEIVAGQTYYVVASLEDSDNFELDTSAIRFVGTSFSYNAPTGELSTGEKIVQFLKKNWLWLVIALVALLILIIIIALIARRKKDDNNGKGSNNNPPYPPYNGGQPPYPPYNGGQPPYPPYGQQPPYGGQPPYYDRMRTPIMPMAGMIQPQMQGSMQPTINGAMQQGIGMQQQMQPQLQGNQMQAIQQPQQVQYVESATPALNAPSRVEAHHISDSGVNMLVEEVHRLRTDVEHIKNKSEEESIKLRSEVENARAMSAVESAKMQAMAEIERVKNEAKFAMQSGSINEAAATTVSNKAGAGDVLGDALMSAVAKMIVQGSINGGSAATVANALNSSMQPMPNTANTNVQNSANAIPQCPPGGRMTTTTTVDMTSTGSSGNIINPTNSSRREVRSDSAIKSSGVNGNPFEVDGLYKKYYDEKGANESLLKPHEHGLYEKYYDDEN